MSVKTLSPTDQPPTGNQLLRKPVVLGPMLPDFRPSWQPICPCKLPNWAPNLATLTGTWTSHLSVTLSAGSNLIAAAALRSHSLRTGRIITWWWRTEQQYIMTWICKGNRSDIYLAVRPVVWRTTEYESLPLYFIKGAASYFNGEPVSATPVAIKSNTQWEPGGAPRGHTEHYTTGAR